MAATATTETGRVRAGQGARPEAGRAEGPSHAAEALPAVLLPYQQRLVDAVEFEENRLTVHFPSGWRRKVWVWLIAATGVLLGGRMVRHD